MPDDKDKAVLAARVLSYLKRKFGNGPQPSPAETNAAITAVTLLSAAFPAVANDPTKMFEKLRQVSRKEQLQTDISELSQIDQMRLQMYMDRRSKMYEMLSNIMKKQSESNSNIAKHLR